MDFVRQLFCRGHGCNTTDEYIPDVQHWLNAIDNPSLFLLSAGAAMTGFVTCLGLLHLIFVLKYIKDEQIRTDLYWLVFMPSVIAACGLVGMVLPRAAIFMYAIALVYYMICIFVLVCLMCTLNGSRKAMCRKLMAKGKRISIRVCPLGCCLFCFDKFEPTEKNFRRFEWLVFQSPIVRILLEILNITVFMELSSRSNLFFQLSNLVGIISLFVGSYGSYIIVPIGASLLHEYRFLLLFRLVDFCQLFWSVQKFIADFIGALNLIPSPADVSTPLPSSAVAQCERRKHRRVPIAKLFAFCSVPRCFSPLCWPPFAFGPRAVPSLTGIGVPMPLQMQIPSRNVPWMAVPIRSPLSAPAAVPRTETSRATHRWSQSIAGGETLMGTKMGTKRLEGEKGKEWQMNGTAKRRTESKSIDQRMKGASD